MVIRETLAVTAKAIDQTSGPINAAAGSMTKAASDVEKANQKSGTSFEAMKDSVTAANQAYQLGSKIIGKFTDAIGGAIDAANIQIAAERKLAALLNLSGNLSAKRVDGINTFNTAIQQTLGIGDERLLQLEALLLAQGVEADQIQSAIKQTIGLTEITGNLETSVKLVGRALNGETSALTRYGIKADSVAEIQEKLNDLFDVAVAQQDTYATASARLSANTDDLVESIGLMVVKSESLIDSTNKSADAVLGFTIQLNEANKSARLYFQLLGELVTGTDDIVEGQKSWIDELEETSLTIFKAIPGYGRLLAFYDSAAEKGKDAADSAKELADAVQEIDGEAAVAAFFGFTPKEAERLEKVLARIRAKFQREQDSARKKAAKTAIREAEKVLKAEIKFQEEEDALADAAIKQDEARLEKLIELNDAEVEAERALRESIADIQQENRDFEREQGTELREIQNQEQIEEIEEAEAAASKISSALASSFTSVITGTQSVGDAFEGLFLRIATSFLENAIGSIFSGIFSAVTGGAGGSIISFIGGLFHEGGVVPGFEHGGLVTGGQRGSDSVLIAAEPGEVVVPVDIVEAFRGILNNTGGGPGFQGGGVVGGGGGGGDINITIPMTVKSLIGDEAVGDRIVQEDLVPALQRAAEMGFLGFFPQLFSGSL